MLQLHATCVALDGAGVLLCGAPGSGKSDLALRLIDAGARLVADDRADLGARRGRVWVTAPPEIAGLIEVRGVGVVRLEALAEVPLALVVDLVAGDAVERLPEPGSRAYLGIPVPVLALAPFQASAAAKVRLAVRGASGDLMTAP